MPKNIGVVIMDGYPIVRWAIREVLSNQSNVCVLGEASSFAEASRLVKLREPDLVITELCSPDGESLQDWLSFFAERSVEVIAFSDCEPRDCAKGFPETAGQSCVLICESMDELVAAVVRAGEGRQWISPVVPETAMNLSS